MRGGDLLNLFINGLEKLQALVKHFPAKQYFSVDEYVSSQLEKQRSLERYLVIIPRSFISNVRMYGSMQWLYTYSSSTISSKMSIFFSGIVTLGFMPCEKVGLRTWPADENATAAFAAPGAKLSPQLFDTLEFEKIDGFLPFAFLGEVGSR